MKNQGSYDVFGRFTRHSATVVFRAISAKGRVFSKRAPDTVRDEDQFPFAVFGVVSFVAERAQMRDPSVTAVRFCRNEAEVAAASARFAAKGCDVVYTVKTSTW